MLKLSSGDEVRFGKVFTFRLRVATRFRKMLPLHIRNRILEAKAMYAIIKTGGKQYRVKEGQRIKLESLAADPGSNVDFEDVLMIVNGENHKVGTPFLDGAKVTAEVIQHGRHRKVEILKFKRRKHHMKRIGHRQNFTEVKITDIESV